MNFSIEDRVSQFKTYYKRENKRPLLGFFLGSEYPMERYHAFGNLPEDRPLTPEDFDVDLFLEDCNRLFEAHEGCGGDFIWSASAFWGIPWVEAALGCPIYVKHKTGSIHSEPPKGFGGAKDVVSFDEKNPWVVKMDEFLSAMAKNSGGRWPIGTTRMRGISDLLAALYGGEEIVFKMLEEPQEIKEVCEKLTPFFIHMANFQLKRIPLYHGGVGSFYYNMWAPKNTVWHQEDTTALLSPSLYEEFIECHVKTIVNAFDSVIMHQHSVLYTPTHCYLKMGMTALEMHIDEGGRRAQDLYETHLAILKQAPLLIWGRLTHEDFKWIMEKLPPQGLAICAVVQNQQEAKNLWKVFANYYQVD